MPEIPASTPFEEEHAQRRKRFRMRYQDGMVEIGLGVILMLETLLNESEHLIPASPATVVLVLIQPPFSLLLFIAGMVAIGYFRHLLLSSRNGPQEIPLASPLLWATLLLMLLLLTASLVWPLKAYDISVYRWAYCALGLAAGGVLAGLGIEHRLPRLWMLGIWCVLLSVSLTFAGQPGYLPNRLAIMLGISAGLLVSGGYALLRYLRLTQALHSRKTLEEKYKLRGVQSGRQHDGTIKRKL